MATEMANVQKNKAAMVLARDLAYRKELVGITPRDEANLMLALYKISKEKES